jgi:hypothetical protein
MGNQEKLCTGNFWYYKKAAIIAAKTEVFWGKGCSVSSLAKNESHTEKVQ